jgi:transposase
MTQLLTADQLQTLTKEDLIALILHQQTLILALTERVKALEDQLAKHSGNSSKPPSSDGLRKKPQSLREKGPRPTGGQPGHKGETLEFSRTPQQITVHEVAQCPQCGTDVQTVAPTHIEKRQVWDLPPLALVVTEHQAPVKCCPGCQQRVQADFPAGVTQPTQYGPRLLAQAAYLTHYQLLPLARTCELFHDWYGQSPSEAVVLSAAQRVQTQVQPSLARIQTHLKSSAVVQSDETGQRVVGKLHWVHVAATDHLTYYAVHEQRGWAAWHDLGILPAVTGYVIHDGWRPYWQLKQCRHGLCNAHHLRDLRFVQEQYQQDWAGELAQLLVSALREVQSAPPTLTSLPAERVQFYTQQYTRLLHQGYAVQPPGPPRTGTQRGRVKQTPPKNLLDHLQQYQTQTLAFLSDFRVPFDNNLAERDLRMLKVKQKVSGTFRTLAGAQTFCAVRSYISTARKQGQRVLTALYEALLGRPFLPA